MVGSSRTAVCGQDPVSTPTTRLRVENLRQHGPYVRGVLLGEDVVGDDDGSVTVGDQARNEGLDQGGLSRADRATDADPGHVTAESRHGVGHQRRGGRCPVGA
jgi:hypothetical protein